MRLDTILSLTDAVADSMVGGLAHEANTGHPHDECELKFLIDPRKLGQRPRPWMLLQGYWLGPNLDRSIRVIPSRRRAYIREKSISYTGCRAKSSMRVPYEEGLALLFRAPVVAYKWRHLVRDEQGRGWLVDYFPGLGHWHAENEFDGPESLHELDAVPEWAVKEVTASPRGYTRSWAIKRPPEELRRLVRFAARNGNTATYNPAPLKPRQEVKAR